MSCTRTEIVAQAQSWLGCKESDGSHKAIIDVYNSHIPKARGYTLKYTDAWCSGFVSACAIACGATDIIPTEVGCEKHTLLFKKMGIWVEDDSYVPAPGDIIFYNWGDSGSGDTIGSADHVGIVEQVAGNAITVIEGNYGNAVKRRTLKVNGRYIRGYGVPAYAAGETPVTVELPVLKKGDKGQSVKPLQRLLHSMEYPLGDNPIDGSFGPKTRSALMAYQKKKGLSQTGQTDAPTWRVLLEVAS